MRPAHSRSNPATSSAERSGRSLSKWLARLPLGLAPILAIYLATRPVNHSEAEDSLWYLVYIDRGSWEFQFHPNHLLYGMVNRLFVRAWQLLGYDGSIALPVICLNIMAGLLMLWLLFRLARNVGAPGWLSWGAVGICAFSYGIWRYSVECETYILPLIFVLLVFLQLLHLRRDPMPWRAHILLGLLCGMAILLHQQHVLLILVVLVGYSLLWMAGRNGLARGAFLARAAVFALTTALLVGATYLFVIIVVAGRTSLDSIMAWVTSAGALGGYGHGLSLSSLKAVVAVFQAFIGAHFLFALPPVSALIARVLPNFGLNEELFLVQGTPLFQVLLLISLTVVLALVALTLVVQALRARALPRLLFRPANLSDEAFVATTAAAYVLIYGGFDVLWLPESLEVWIAVLPMLVLVLCLLLLPLANRRLTPAFLATSVSCLLIVNLWGSMLPQMNPQRDYWRQFNAWLIDHASEKDLIVSGSGYIADGYLEYYAGAKVFSTVGASDRTEGKLKALIEQSDPQRVLFTSTVADPLAGQVVTPDRDAIALFADYSPRLQLLHEDAWQTIYSLGE